MAIKNCMYLMYEKRNALKEDIEACDKLLKKDKEFLAVVNHGIKEVKPKNDFSEFVSDLKYEIEGYPNQKEALKEVLSHVENVIALYEKGNQVDATENEKMTAKLVEMSITTIALCLGIVPTEKAQEIARKQEEYEAKKAKERQDRINAITSQNVKA